MNNDAEFVGLPDTVQA